MEAPKLSNRPAFWSKSKRFYSFNQAAAFRNQFICLVTHKKICLFCYYLIESVQEDLKEGACILHELCNLLDVRVAQVALLNISSEMMQS